MQTNALVLIIVVSSFACTTNTADEMKIVDARMSFNRAIANHDTSAMGQYLTNDILVITSRNTRFTGSDQYSAGLEQEFKSKEDVVYIRTPDAIELFPSWEMAAESGHWIGKWKSVNESIEVGGTYYAKWKRVDSQWKISAEIYTALHCSGGSYCLEVPK